MGIGSNAHFCVNGQEAIDRATKILDEFLASRETKNRKPITAMLLDLQMPVKSGFQVVCEVRDLFEKHKERVDPPEFMIVSAFNSP